jgi:hypothetical protein
MITPATKAVAQIRRIAASLRIVSPMHRLTITTEGAAKF